MLINYIIKCLTISGDSRCTARSLSLDSLPPMEQMASHHPRLHLLRALSSRQPRRSLTKLQTNTRGNPNCFRRSKKRQKHPPPGWPTTRSPRVRSLVAPCLCLNRLAKEEQRPIKKLSRTLSYLPSRRNQRRVPVFKLRSPKLKLTILWSGNPWSLNLIRLARNSD